MQYSKLFVLFIFVCVFNHITTSKPIGNEEEIEEYEVEDNEEFEYPEELLADDEDYFDELTFGVRERQYNYNVQESNGYYYVTDLVEGSSKVALVKPVKQVVKEGILSNTLAEAWFLDLEKDAFVVVCNHPETKCYFRIARLSQIPTLTDELGLFFDRASKLESFAFTWTLEDAVRAKVDSVGFVTADEAIVFSLQRLEQANEYCSICHEEIDLSDQVFRPTICDKSLCSFKLHEYGFSLELETEILKNPEVTDLILSLAFAAATKSNENSQISPLWENNKIIEVLDTLPSVSDMANWLKANPNKKLTSYLSLEQFKIVVYLHSLNRAYIKLLEPHQRLTNLEGYMQFSFHFSSPKNEVAFQNLKHKSSVPSVFGFHGSASNNWFHIITKGYNFDRVVNGRLAGDGVYFGYELETSLSYTLSDLNWKNSIFKNRLLILSVNEIVYDPSHFVSTNPFLVVNKTVAIQPRFLLIRNYLEKFQRNVDDNAPSSKEFIPRNPKDLKALSNHQANVDIPVAALMDIKVQPQELIASTFTTEERDQVPPTKKIKLM